MGNQKVLFAAAGVVVGLMVFETIRRSGAAAVSLVNPADPDNIVNQGTSAVIEKVSGGRFLSVGDFFFNLLNPDAPGEVQSTQYGAAGTNDF